MAKYLDQIAERIKERRNLDKQRLPKLIHPFDSFLEKIARQTKLIDSIEKCKDIDEQIKIEARKNFMISWVTALEVYLKDMVWVLIDGFPSSLNQEGIENLLKKKISLWEVFEIIQKERITKGELIAAEYSFLSLEQIDYIFKNILGHESFLLEIEKTVLTAPNKKPFILNKKWPNWKSKITKIFELRHKYVHQVNFQKDISFEESLDMFACLLDFVKFVDEYLLNVI